MGCVLKTGPDNLGQNIPLWTIEARSLPASNAVQFTHNFTTMFKSVPFVTATAKGGPGLVNISIIKVTKEFVEIALSAPSPGMNIEMHALSLDPSFDCPCPEWITGIAGPCEGVPIDPHCCEVGTTGLGPPGITGWCP